MRNLSLNEINVTGGNKCFQCVCQANPLMPKIISASTAKHSYGTMNVYYAIGPEKILLKPGQKRDVIAYCIDICYMYDMAFDAIAEQPC